jgi:hypothetical protein
VNDQATEAQGPLPRYAFTDEELQRFYIAKWKIRSCEICEIAQWSVDIDNEPVACIATSDGITLSTFGSTLTAHLRISCGSCGNTKFMLAAVIRHWLDANP